MGCYAIKHTNHECDWFWVAERRWSDSFYDAFRFTSKAAAEREAKLACDRMTKHDVGVPGSIYPKIKVIYHAA